MVLGFEDAFDVLTKTTDLFCLMFSVLFVLIDFSKV